jgi:hypothetical protein
MNRQMAEPDSWVYSSRSTPTKVLQPAGCPSRRLRMRIAGSLVRFGISRKRHRCRVGAPPLSRHVVHHISVSFIIFQATSFSCEPDITGSM